MIKMWRISTAMTVAALAAGSSAAAAQAAAKLKVNPASAPPGTPTMVNGSGFAPGEVVDVTLDGAGTDAQTAVANSSGVFHSNLPLPAAFKPGRHQVTGIGRTSQTGAGATLTVTTPWTQAGFDGSHTADNPFENQITQETVSRLSAAWIGAADSSTSENVSSPVAAAGRVFFTTTKGLYAYDASCGTGAATCTPLWHADLADAVTLQPPVLLHNMVFVQTAGATGAIYAFKTSCGKNGAACSPVWTAPEQAGSGPMSASATRLYVTSAGRLDAFKPTCGKRTCSPVWSATLDALSYSGTAVSNGVVYVGTSNSTLYAFSEKGCTTGTCAPAWTATGPTTFTTNLTVANGRVFVGGAAFSTTCSSSPCGPVWTGDGISQLFSNIAAYGDRLFIGNNGLDSVPQECAMSSTCQAAYIDADSNVSPTLAANVLYSVRGPNGAKGYPNEVVAYAPDCGNWCTPLWRSSPSADPGERFDSSPAISDGTLYATTNEGRLYAFTLDGQAAGTAAS